MTNKNKMLRRENTTNLPEHKNILGKTTIRKEKILY